MNPRWAPLTDQEFVELRDLLSPHGWQMPSTAVVRDIADALGRESPVVASAIRRLLSPVGRGLLRDREG